MSTQTNITSNDTFTIGWIVLLFISALSALWFIILMFGIVSEATLFMSGAAFSLLTSLIPCIPCRRGEMKGWSEEQFITTMRTGITPGGKQLIEFMPWKYFGQMTDDELKAVWMYLQSLPALLQGK
jgi:hypothetical protein